MIRQAVKNSIKRVSPALLDWIIQRRTRRILKGFDGLSRQEAFSKIYKQRLWGEGTGATGGSGFGSHDKAVTQPYIEHVAAFLRTLPQPPRLVDLGCGDFNVGRQLLPWVADYHGCDIVPALIEHHRREHATDHVSFSFVDLVTDELPAGDVATLRQVLQHLDNQAIIAILTKLSRYSHVIITEHLPTGTFTPNRDKPVGPGIRLTSGSGVVIGTVPFGLADFHQRLLCSVKYDGGIIETRLWRQH